MLWEYLDAGERHLMQTGEVREVSSVEVPSELRVVDKKVSAR